MKKVLSVAMASAMVLGMGANAFAIQYSTGSNDKAEWPSNFKFEGQLFVTDKDGNIVKEASTAINTQKSVNFEPGDTIWMPLYADNQKVYGVVGGNTDEQKEVAATTISLGAVLNQTIPVEGKVSVDANGVVAPFTYKDNVNKVVYYYGYVTAPTVEEGWRTAKITTAYTTVNGVKSTAVVDNKLQDSPVDAIMGIKAVKNGSKVDFHIGKSYSAAVLDDTTNTSFNALTDNLYRDSAGTYYNPTTDRHKTITYAECMSFYTAAELQSVLNGTVDPGKKVTVSGAIINSGYQNVLKDGVAVYAELPKVEGKDLSEGTVVGGVVEQPGQTIVNTVAHGHYTGNIDKNWSINLIEKSTGVAELIEKAELYKATAADVTSYGKYSNEVVANGVYLKITLEDEWKTTSSETLKYYVYIADNKAKDHKTNEVWVSGKYENTDYEWVNFDWTNDASRSKLWKVHDDENGVAVFDFADKAFFSVKMYGGETMYLDLETAYDKAIAGEMDAEADSFYKFTGSNANFARTGELIIVSDDSSLVPYQIDEDGNFVAVDAEYVENYAVAHTNKKVNGFVFNTKQLGNYVLSTEELGEEEEPAEEPTTEEPVVEEPVVEEPVVEETNKPNPNTGAEDFVGLAVSLAVVSVAAAGALALKK